MSRMITQAHVSLTHLTHVKSIVMWLVAINVSATVIILVYYSFIDKELMLGKINQIVYGTINFHALKHASLLNIRYQLYDLLKQFQR